MNIKNVGLSLLLMGGCYSLAYGQEAVVPQDRSLAAEIDSVMNQDSQKNNGAQTRLVDIDNLLALKKFLDDCRQEALQGKTEGGMQKLDGRLEELIMQYIKLEEQKVQRLSQIDVAAWIGAISLVMMSAWLGVRILS